MEGSPGPAAASDVPLLLINFIFIQKEWVSVALLTRPDMELECFFFSTSWNVSVAQIPVLKAVIECLARFIIFSTDSVINKSRFQFKSYKAACVYITFNIPVIYWTKVTLGLLSRYILITSQSLVYNRWINYQQDNGRFMYCFKNESIGGYKEIELQNIFW